MTFPKALWIAGGSLIFLSSLHAFQREWRLYRSLEPYDDVSIPTDGQDHTEWVFARLMFPSQPYTRFSPRNGNWREGGTSWSEDYPRADRHFLMALRRLTRIDARSLEQPVNLDDADDVYNWPWLYAGLPGDWNLSDQQAVKLRDYLLRGGFFMADDFWGASEWEVFEQGIQKVFPDRQIVEIDNQDPIFHMAYDLDDRYQIPGEWGLRQGGSRNGGTVPYWRGIYDDKGRLMVAITFNSDLGDSWEWADVPYYPDKYSELGIRIGVNYVLYGMTH